MNNSYDTLGRLTSKLNKKPDGSMINSYAYTLNNSDERTRMTLSNGKYISYNYDAAGQVTGAQMYNQDASANNSYKYGFTYDPAGNATQRTTNGQTRDYTFNNVNEFASATAPTSTNVSGQASPVSTAPFTVSVNGSPAEVYSDGTWVKQNVALTSGLNQIQITGNDKFNRSASDILNITLAAAPIYTYDANGNTTGDGLWTYTYNDENRLTQTGKATLNLEFSYDGNGRRREKKVFEESSLVKHLRFAYNGFKLIAELDGLNSDTIIRQFTWDGDTPLTMTDADGTFHYVLDGNKNVTALIDSAGNVRAEYKYSPFGDIVFQSGDKADDNPIRFSSEYYDTETELIYYGLRYDSPRLARWLSRDPLGELGGTNPYKVANNNMINDWDVLGLLPYDTFVQRINADRAKYKGQQKDAEEWLKIIKRYYTDDGGTPQSAMGSGKYMLTRKAGVIDLEHYLNIADRVLSSSKNKNIQTTREIAKIIVKTEDDLERKSYKSGLGVDVEDSPSNYRGATLALIIKQKGCKTYDEVANEVIAQVKSFQALQSQQEEDRFLKYVNRPGIGYFTYFNLTLMGGDFTIFKDGKQTMNMD